MQQVVLVALLIVASLCADFAVIERPPGPNRTQLGLGLILTQASLVFWWSALSIRWAPIRWIALVTTLILGTLLLERLLFPSWREALAILSITLAAITAFSVLARAGGAMLTETRTSVRSRPKRIVLREMFGWLTLASLALGGIRIGKISGNELPFVALWISGCAAAAIAPAFLLLRSRPRTRRLWHDAILVAAAAVMPTIILVSAAPEFGALLRTASAHLLFGGLYAAVLYVAGWQIDWPAAQATLRIAPGTVAGSA